MKIIHCTILGLLFFQTAFSQDTLFLKNRRQIIGTVQQVGDHRIYFRKLGRTKNALPIPTSMVDSIGFKYQHRQIFLKEKKSGFWEHREMKKRRQRSHSYVDPFKNRLDVGPMLIHKTVPILGWFSREDITPVFAMQATYEYRILNNLDLTITPIVGLNRRYFSGLIATHYFMVNRERINLGLGPMVGFGLESVKLFVPLGSPYPPPPHYSNSFTVGANLKFQAALSSRLLLNQDFYLGNTRFPGYEQVDPFISYRLGIGFRF